MSVELISILTAVVTLELTLTGLLLASLSGTEARLDWLPRLQEGGYRCIL